MPDHSHITRLATLATLDGVLRDLDCPNPGHRTAQFIRDGRTSWRDANGWTVTVENDPLVSLRSNDIFHVIIDAITHLRADINHAQPWKDYDTSDDDPKSTRAGYLAILGLAEKHATELLSQPPTFEKDPSS